MHKENWQSCEETVKSLIDSVKDHSDFEVVDSLMFKNFLQENMVMAYHNIDLGPITNLGDRLDQL